MFTCGSSNFLKHKFGVGYNLTIVKHEICDDSKIKKIVQEQVWVSEDILFSRFLKLHCLRMLVWN